MDELILSALFLGLVWRLIWDVFFSLDPMPCVTTSLLKPYHALRGWAQFGLLFFCLFVFSFFSTFYANMSAIYGLHAQEHTPILEEFVLLAPHAVHRPPVYPLCFTGVGNLCFTPGANTLALCPL